MNAPTKGSHGEALKWVGRAIRRLEDPALVTGQGHFTADLSAAHWVRFVRSPNAAGKIDSIKAPDGAMDLLGGGDFGKGFDFRKVGREKRVFSRQ